MSAKAAPMVCCGGHRERCNFGLPHTWCIGGYVNGEWQADRVKCGVCDVVCTAEEN